MNLTRLTAILLIPLLLRDSPIAQAYSNSISLRVIPHEFLNNQAIPQPGDCFTESSITQPSAITIFVKAGQLETSGGALSSFTNILQCYLNSKITLQRAVIGILEFLDTVTDSADIPYAQFVSDILETAHHEGLKPIISILADASKQALRRVKGIPAAMARLPPHFPRSIREWESLPGYMLPDTIPESLALSFKDSIETVGPMIWNLPVMIAAPHARGQIDHEFVKKTFYETSSSFYKLGSELQSRGLIPKGNNDDFLIYKKAFDELLKNALDNIFDLQNRQLVSQRKNRVKMSVRAGVQFWAFETHDNGNGMADQTVADFGYSKIIFDNLQRLHVIRMSIDTKHGDDPPQEKIFMPYAAPIIQQGKRLRPGTSASIVFPVLPVQNHSTHSRPMREDA